ncbi:MAG TPA: hypothetical protein DEB43_06525 [Desulfovibrio sp.]|nr:hypothetical protein [Desulfovibrio sp.]
MNNVDKIASQIRLFPKGKQENIIAELKEKQRKNDKLHRGELMQLKEYLYYVADELTYSKPKQLKIGGVEQNFGTSWTDFTVHCVKQFVKNGYIKENFKSFALKSGKVILTTSMSVEFDHIFKKVSPFCYVDTKFNAHDHIQNLIYIMEYLGVDEEIELSIYRNNR